MDRREELLELRASTGMNRREFCEYFGIPYRTVQDWETGRREMPGYLLELMRYKVMMENVGTGAGSERERYDCVTETWNERKRRLLARIEMPEDRQI